MREKLLDRLYRSFDKDAAPGLALRVRHADDLCWKVAERVLTLTTEAGLELGAFPLAGQTIAQLADNLTAIGCDVTYQNPEFSSRAADALMDGESRQSVSNGDHLYVYDSLLWSLLDAYAFDLETADHFAIIEGIRQAYMHSAQQEWLDYWGSYFGIVREDGENDEVYLKRIVVEVLRPRNNARAIEQTIFDLTGVHVTLMEPWKQVFRLDVSELSGDHYLHDGNYWTWNVFQPIFHDRVSDAMFERIMRIIERNRPIGCLPVRERAEPPIAFAKLDREWHAWFGGREASHFEISHYQEGVLSSSAYLSDGRVHLPVKFQLTVRGTDHIRAYARWAGFDATARWGQVTWRKVLWGGKALKFVITDIP